MASGLTRNQMPRKGLWVRIPCPPLCRQPSYERPPVATERPVSIMVASFARLQPLSSSFRAGLIVGLLFAATCAGMATSARGIEPAWISSPEADQRACTFSTTFDCHSGVQVAVLRFAADFCDAVVHVNGSSDGPVLEVESFCQLCECDVTSRIRRGKNQIRVVTGNVVGPAAVALSLAVVDKNGSTTIVTDERWDAIPGAPGGIAATVRKAKNLGKVRPELWNIGRRAAAISPLDNYEQWQQMKKGSAAAHQPKFWTAPGFEITELRKAGPDEGSWIAMAFDSRGRLTISREDQGLLRMTLADNRQTISRVEPIKVELKECRGLLYANDYLYANANNSQAMYRLRLAENATVEDIQKLRAFPGKPGHGRNDLALGPGGKLFSIYGDAVVPPKENVIDRTSPLRESRRRAPRSEGYLLRTDLDGKQWELVCTGLRNAYGLAIHPNGDVFTFDADNEYDLGSPWYRPTRILQLRSGADFGWRLAQDRWPPEFPDHPGNALPVIDVGRASPTAAMFGTQLNFPAPYRGALFVLDWAYGRVLAVHLAERGAGYRAALELFLQGQPLNVTDVCGGPDGAMYLITGGRKTQSSLYRVEYTGPVAADAGQGQHELDCTAFSRKQRALCGKLEAFHGRADSKALDAAWPYLSDADPVIRYAARIAIEQLPPGEWQQRVFGSSVGEDGRAPWSAWLALLDSGDASLVPTLLPRLLEAKSTRLSEQFILLHLYRQCFALNRAATMARRSQITPQLGGIWSGLENQSSSVSPAGDRAELRRRLALLLADLDAPGIIDRICKSLLASAVQEDQIMGLLALRHTTMGWTLETRRTYFDALNGAARFVGGQGMPGFIDRLRSDALATLDETERSQLGNLLEAAKPAEEPLPRPRPTVKQWKLADLQALATERTGEGDPRRGKAVFHDALCSRCHRSGIAGPAVGPDLTFVARRFSRHDILESILEPSAVVAETYRNAQIQTDDGRVYIGRIASEGDYRSENLLLSTDPLHPAAFVKIDKKKIVEHQLVATSPMPQGLLDGFTADEIFDLLAFLEAGAAP